MVAITKDDRRVNKAQALYDSGLGKLQTLIEQIDRDIPEISDILHGHAMGKSDAKYQISKEVRSALREQLNLWKANVQNPERVLANINDGLKKSHGSSRINSGGVGGSSKPTLAIFNPKAQG